MIDHFGSLHTETKQRLMLLASRVTDVRLIDPRTFRIQTHQLDPNTRPKTILDKVSKKTCEGHTYLYYFRVLNNFELEKVEHTFSKVKEETKNLRRYPRFNRQSEFLYVGASSDISQRFREHLGYGSEKTYSLQLAHWARTLNLELEFVYAKYPSGMTRDVIQAIEDTLWDILSPMFGRKGAR